MESLKEFLAERGEQIRAEGIKTEQARAEWFAAVSRLIRQIQDWLVIADPDEKFLTVDIVTREIREEGLGTYGVPGLSVRLGPREIRVEPIARYVAGLLAKTGGIHVPRAYGRVDLTNGLEKFLIFRSEKEPQDRWDIVEQNSFQMRPLDQESFEAAFKGLLE